MAAMIWGSTEAHPAGPGGVRPLNAFGLSKTRLLTSLVLLRDRVKRSIRSYNEEVVASWLNIATALVAIWRNGNDIAHIDKVTPGMSPWLYAEKLHNAVSITPP